MTVFLRFLNRIRHTTTRKDVSNLLRMAHSNALKNGKMVYNVKIRKR